MQQIYLNIIPNGICPRVYVNQYDVGRGIQIKFKDGSANYGFASGTTFKVNGRKSDGHVFEYTEADKWDATNYIILKSMPPGGATTVYLYTTEQMTAASGEVLMQLTYKLDNAVQGTLNFIMIVQERPEATGDPSESDVPGVVRLVNGVAPDADGEVILKWKDQSSVSNLSITENTRTMSTTRNAGTYVYVKTDDQLYVITSTISSGGTLTPGTNATATSVGAALSTLTSELTDKVDKSGANFSFNNTQLAPDSNNNTKLYTSSELVLASNANVYMLANNGVYAMSPSYGSYKPITASAFTVGSSRLIKENIKALSDDEAKKILDVETVAFDYKESFGGQRDQYGVIAEDVEKIIPFVVSTPETYDESAFDESKGAGQPLKSVDYSKFVPYLIRMIQIQQAEIDELKKQL